MNIDDLQAFIAVADTGSFSLAADKLFITQPAVSKRIAALEASLNHKLFDRIGRHVALTPAGTELLPRALNIIQQLKDTKRTLQELSGEIVGVLRIATSHHIGLHHLPPILQQFSDQHPEVNLEVEFVDSEKAYQRVTDGECELGIVTLAPSSAAPLSVEIIWPDPLSFVVSIRHPLAGLSQNQQISLRDLGRYRAILPDANTYTGRLIRSHFESANVKIDSGMTTNYLETIKMMVSVGLGWSVLPQTMLDKQLMQLAVEAEPMVRHLGVIRHQQRTLGNAAKKFYDMLHYASNQKEKA